MNDETIWQDRKVLLSGYSGFIGGVLTEQLLEKGAEVFCLVRNPDTLTKKTSAAKLHFLRADITEARPLLHCIENTQADILFHLAGQAIQDSDKNYTVNTEGTRNILQALTDASPATALVFVSSDSVYGTGKENAYTESDIPAPVTPYAESKLLAEAIVKDYSDKFELNSMIARLSNVYGGQDKNFSHLIPDQIKRVLRGDAPSLNSNGKPVGDFIYIDDIVEGLLILGEGCLTATYRAEIFNLSTGKPSSVLHVVNMILELCHAQSMQVQLNENASSPEFIKQVSPQKSFERFQWKAKTELRQGLQKTIKAYQDYL